jgi:hypothetical protein
MTGAADAKPSVDIQGKVDDDPATLSETDGW